MNDLRMVAVELSSVQKWMLSYLAYRDFRASELGNNAKRYDEITRLSELNRELPPSLVFDHIENFGDVKFNIDEMMSLGLVKHEGYHDDDPYYKITQEGMVVFKHLFYPIIALARHPKEYNRIMDATVGNAQVRSELKQLGKKMKDRAEDEIANSFFEAIKKIGSQSLVYFVNAIEQAHTSGDFGTANA